MLRSWVEKSRIKSAMNDEDRKKRMAALMSSDIDASLKNARADAPHRAGSVHFPVFTGSKASFMPTVRGSARPELQRSNTVNSSVSSQGDRESSTPALSRQPSASILQDLATLGAGDDISGSSAMPPPAPFVRQNSLKVAPSAGNDGIALPSARLTPRVSFEQQSSSQPAGDVKTIEAQTVSLPPQKAAALMDVRSIDYYDMLPDDF
jgi:hypothetical protein